MSEKKPLPPFTPSQHRRRISLPTTPPETPMNGYFGTDARKSMSSSTARVHPVYPASPPQTPTRAVSEKEKETLPFPSSHRSRPSRAYAHHRRTSTATLLRLAAARQGLHLTPSKAITLFLIVFSATYLASFLPSPLSLLFPHPVYRSSRPSQHIVPSSGTYVHNNNPAVQPVGDVAQRRAWQSAFPYRIPPHQHVVVPHDEEALEAAPSSLDGDVMRAHPELLANQARQARRRPLRMTKDADASAPTDAPSRPARPTGADTADDSFDDASRSPRRPSQQQAGRQAQLNRMKKVASGKGRNARVGQHLPIDSSEQQAAARAEQDRIIVDSDVASHRRLRQPKGARPQDNLEQEYALKKAATKKKPVAAQAVAEPEGRDASSAPADEPKGTDDIDEDWTGSDDADEGDE
ncbi:hypothetical protein JCM10207_002264 [Rhodosporidiobolus poonsookiae]